MSVGRLPKWLRSAVILRAVEAAVDSSGAVLADTTCRLRPATTLALAIRRSSPPPIARRNYPATIDPKLMWVDSLAHGYGARLGSTLDWGSHRPRDYGCRCLSESGAD